VSGGNIDITCSTPVSNTGTGTPNTGPYALTVNVSPALSGTISATPTGAAVAFACGSTGVLCTGTYASGSAVTLTATALSGFTFTSWSGGPCNASTSTTCAVPAMTGAVSMTATFTSSGGTGTTAPPGVVMKAFPANNLIGSGSYFYGDKGVTYAMPLPTTPNGRASVYLSPEGPPPLIGTNGHWELSLSKVPGDWTTAKTSTVPGWGGVATYPYYDNQGGQSGGVTWIPFVGTGGYTGLPYIPPGEQWYLNLRFTDISGAIVFTWAPQ
jgi:hypothetical protein